MGKPRQTNRQQNVNGTQQGVRPLFIDALRYSREIYDPRWNIETLQKNVAEKIGGQVKYNIENGIFVNTCAIRMSYILHRCGLKIDFKKGQTSSGTTVDDKGNKQIKWYYYRVDDLIKFLTKEWVKPDKIIDYPTEKDLKGKKGIIIFKTNFSDATGHATLIDGTHTAASCYDHCYFYDATQKNKTTEAHFWELR